MTSQAQPDGRATKAKAAFRMQYADTINIRAKADKIWGLLTNSDDLPRWNSTITSVEGTIAPGETLELRVPLAPTRTPAFETYAADLKRETERS